MARINPSALIPGNQFQYSNRQPTCSHPLFRPRAGFFVSGAPGDLMRTPRFDPIARSDRARAKRVPKGRGPGTGRAILPGAPRRSGKPILCQPSCLPCTFRGSFWWSWIEFDAAAVRRPACAAAQTGLRLEPVHNAVGCYWLEPSTNAPAPCAPHVDSNPRSTPLQAPAADVTGPPFLRGVKRPARALRAQFVRNVDRHGSICTLQAGIMEGFPGCNPGHVESWIR